MLCLSLQRPYPGDFLIIENGNEPLRLKNLVSIFLSCLNGSRESNQIVYFINHDRVWESGTNQIMSYQQFANSNKEVFAHQVLFHLKGDSREKMHEGLANSSEISKQKIIDLYRSCLGDSKIHSISRLAGSSYFSKCYPIPPQQ